MRGTGTLRSIIGKPVYPTKANRDEAEPDLHEGPFKRQKKRSKSAGAGTAAGQKSIFNFYQLAAPPAAASASSGSRSRVLQPPSGVKPAADPAGRSSSAPVLLSGPPCEANNNTNTSRTSSEPEGSPHWADTPSQDQGLSQGQGKGPSPEACVSSQPSQARRGPPVPQAPLVFSTRVVGRQHQSAAWPPAPGCSLQLVREASNPVDPCAILVCSVDCYGIKRSYGHLPAGVACHLAPLLDGNMVAVRAELAATAEAAAAAAGPGQASSRAATPHPQQGGSVGEAAQQAADTQGTAAGQPQEQHQLQLHLELLDAAGHSAAAASAVTSAISQAAAAGRVSLAPVQSSGAVLAAAFDHILSQTQLHDLHLLSEAEQEVLQHMQSLPGASKALLLHLLLRKRTWFQLSSLRYADVPQPEAAASRLSAVGLLQWDSDAHADLDALLQELPVVLLKQVLAALLPRGHPAIAAVAAAAAGRAEGARGPDKASVLSSIQANASRARLHAAIVAAAGPCVTVTPAAADTFARLQLLYFATPGHDLSMFLAVQRGAVSYPSYPIQRTRPIFSSRQQLLDYEGALGLAARVDAALEEGDTDAGWRLMQQALSALQGGVHKGVVWDEACAPMPNPPPRQQPAQDTGTTPAPAPTPASAGPAAAAAAAEAAAACIIDLVDDVPQHNMGQAASKADVAGLAHPSARQPAASAGTTLIAAASNSCQGQAKAAAADSGLYVQHGSGLRQGSSSAAQCDGDQADSSSDVSWDTADTQREQEGTAADTAAASAAAAGAAGGAVDQLHGGGGVSSAMQAPDPLTTQQAEAAAAAGSQGAAAATAAVAPVAVATAAAGAQASNPPLFFARFCAGWVHASLGTVAVSLLEKQKRWGDAIELLRLLLGGNACVGRRGEWWTRLAINLEHLGRAEDALEAAEAALADSWVRWGDLLGLQRRYLRLGKPPRRWKRPPWAQAVSWEPTEVVITARPLNNTTGTKSRFYAPDNSQVTVEQLALQHYASEEAGAWQGLHCEGGVWATLFTLLLWDVVFMGVPDVFRGPFQTCPLDLDTDAFYTARRNQLDAALARIADGHAGAMLQSVWAANAGVMARGVNWQRFSQQQLLEICDCLGGLGLAAVLRLMAEDHAGAAGGLPDLLLWRPLDTSAKLVEVKGPRDTLSHQQRFWLAHMADNTLQVEVLKVKEPQSNKRK